MDNIFECQWVSKLLTALSVLTSWRQKSCIYLSTGYGITQDYKILNPAPHLLARTMTEVCLPSVEFVDKNNLEAQNPRRDTSIPSGSAGLGKGSRVFSFGDRGIQLSETDCKSKSHSVSIILLVLFKHSLHNWNGKIIKFFLYLYLLFLKFEIRLN